MSNTNNNEQPMPESPELSEEMQELVDMVRILVGDTDNSLFYPMLSDNEVVALLKLEQYNVLRAARRAATTIAFFLATTNTRERSGDIEVFNNASAAYKDVLENFLNESGSLSLPNHLLPYAAGISNKDYCKSINNPDTRRSPLAQITPCNSWWTDTRKHSPCKADVFQIRKLL